MLIVAKLAMFLLTTDIVVATHSRAVRLIQFVLSWVSQDVGKIYKISR